MTPTLFSMLFSAMLFRTVILVVFKYHFDGKLFNLKRLQAKTKVQTDVRNGLLYVDDMDKNASSESKRQRSMNQVLQSCDNYDFTISIRKTGCTPTRTWKTVK